MTDVTCSVGGCAKGGRIIRGFCEMHYRRWLRQQPPRRVSLAERFWSKVDKRGPDECWNWTASKQKGYGQFMLGGRPRRAHRVAYELLVGPIPEGLTLDHLCRNPSCVNPAHLEPVTLSENVIRAAAATRKDCCVNGHEFTPDNIWWRISPSGRRWRVCRACNRERAVARMNREKPDRLPAHALRTHCPRGHAYDEANTYYNKNGHRSCRACHRERERERQRARRSSVCRPKAADLQGAPRSR